VIYWARAARVRGATEADAPLMEAAALQSLGRLQDSGRLIDSLMVHFKQDPDVAAAFGREMMLEKRPTRAVGPLRYAVSWAPNDASLALLLGDAYVHVGQMQLARDQIRRAVGLEPGNIEAWVRLASVCHLMDDVEGRDAALKNAASLPGADQARLRQIWQKMNTPDTTRTNSTTRTTP
jgi:Flp pilus assembly protein TadD